MASKIQALLSRATQTFQEGQLEAAGKLLLEVLDIEHENIAAKELLAYVYGSKGDELHARQLLREVVGSPDASLTALYEYGALLLNSSPDEAINPLERALAIQPHSFEVLHDLATAYAFTGRKKEAIEKYTLAAKLNGNSSELFYNIGCLHEELFDFEKANLCYRKSLSLDPQFARALINLGLNLNQAGKYDEGIALLEKAHALQPDVDFIFGHIIHGKMQIGFWANYEKDLERVKNNVSNGQRIIHPLNFLSLVDDPYLQQRAAEIYAQSRPHGSPHIRELNQQKNKKIRVAYFSADFQNHPVTHLTAELYELHDKDIFEIYAFSSGFKTNDEQRLRLMKSFDEFIDILSLSDDEVISLAKSKGIDIAVDLGGYTDKARIGVFEKRVAPVQVSYLGYLGTLGSSCMDYIFADHNVIPIESQKFFSEKIAYLPQGYQINDRQRVIANSKFTRAQFNLPDEGFIFCSFNNSYKINPEVFSSWCRILKRVDGSVLWLYESNRWIAENLRREAEFRGVDPSRLIFSGVLPVPEYLARYRLADLFLDTFPYNAGTTASDALWSGLPVLTRSGKSFPSRMAGSILKAIDLPELITYSIGEYEELAVELATHRSKLQCIRKKIEANRMSTPLFDSPQTTKNIERAFQIMYSRYLDGKDPENIELV
jgi:protein O-GlcNAc transferase